MGLQRSTMALTLGLGALLAGCAALQPSSSAPIPEAASKTLARIRALEWSGKDPTGGERRALLAEVISSAPSWVSPMRLLDELDRSKLRGPEVLGRRRSQLEEAVEPAARARAAYLLGRLGGEGSRGLMRDSVRDDPSFAWGYHGLAWSASEGGDASAAILHERRAIHFARDAFDRALFTRSLAHHLQSDDRGEDAYEELAELSRKGSLNGADAIWLIGERASLGLRLEDEELVEQCWEDLLLTLADPLLGEDPAAQFAQRLRAARRERRDLDPGGLRLDAALSFRGEDAVIFQRARLAHECGRFVRAAALWDRLQEGELAPPTRERRVAAFASGRFGVAVARWLEELPSVAKDVRGLPKSERLVAVVAAARRVASTRSPRGTLNREDALRALGDACVEAGWFAEAQALAPHLAAVDATGAFSLSERADRAFGLLEFFDRSLGKELQPIPEAGAEERAAWLGIERFLSALEDEVEVARALFGEQETDSLKESLAVSPLYEFSPFAALVHPGPVMSRQDQRLGVGRAGHLVQGLAELGNSLGRFILLGQLAGRDRADGAVFPVLWTERAEGEHLGVRWSGSVFWCEGIEPVGWLGRNSGVTGAALHDGYWIDVEAVRREHERWLALSRQWSMEEAEDVLRILAPRAETERERRALRPLLRAGERVQLELFLDRGGAVPDMAELLEGVAIHEQGHLVDRALHLPLSAHPLRAVRLLGRAAFDPPAVLERLEYRAQVVALCAMEDPRIALAESLLMVENAPSTARAHARGYEALLRDLLGILDQRIHSDPLAWPRIDPERVLVQQLHRLEPEEVRRLGRALAKHVGIP